MQIGDIVVEQHQLTAGWEDKTMKIAEMEQNSKENGLLKANVDGSSNGIFRFFITDNERGIPEYGNVYDTEDETCDALLKKISRSEKIYQKSNRLSE
jgi:hypothetical protein